jgi:hypothetical protein
LGAEGIEDILPFETMSSKEKEMMTDMIPDLLEDILKGVNFANTETN